MSVIEVHPGRTQRARAVVYQKWKRGVSEVHIWCIVAQKCIHRVS
jgi:hypothetical protein